MRKLGFVLSLGMCLALSLPAYGAGLPVTIENRAGRPIECHAVAGHWYGFDLGTVAAGGTARVGFGLDHADGAVTLPGPGGASLPIQYVYCGLVGDAWQSRTYLALRPLAGAGRPARLACRDAGGHLDCR